jgi:hypothetical protein
MDEYLLPPCVHCCRLGDAFVFLDLKQDDYTLIPGEGAAALAMLASEPTLLNEAHAHSLQKLVTAGLLTTRANDGRRFTATSTSFATESLLDGESLDESSVSPAHVWNFIAACITAAIRLKSRSIESTVTRVARRKARHARTDLDMERARQLSAVFRKLRALFPANYLCLFDSLALIEFLARYDLFPTWVFGVRLAPWAAHCWVQHGDVAFNEDIEQAAHYTQIMAI